MQGRPTVTIVLETFWEDAVNVGLGKAHRHCYTLYGEKLLLENRNEAETLFVKAMVFSMSYISAHLNRSTNTVYVEPND